MDAKDRNADFTDLSTLLSTELSASECEAWIREMQALEQHAYQAMRKDSSPEKFSMWKAVVDAATAAQSILSKDRRQHPDSQQDAPSQQGTPPAQPATRLLSKSSTLY